MLRLGIGFPDSAVDGESLSDPTFTGLHTNFFDFGLIGFVLAIFVRDWHLTFGNLGLSCYRRAWQRWPGAEWPSNAQALRHSFASLAVTTATGPTRAPQQGSQGG
jgi:hypothetical protein